MSIQYDLFIASFLQKISEYTFLELPEENRDVIVDGYLKRAASSFRKNCLYDLTGSANDESRVFEVEIKPEDLDEIVDILSEGMVVQWLKPYIYQQELLQNVLNTRDYTQYSPAELLSRVGNAYRSAQKDYTQMIREYSFNHGGLKNLHI